MMKEFKLQEMLPLEGVKSKIWTMFDILRREDISSDDYHIVLFLLSAYKDGLLATVVITGDRRIEEIFIESLHDVEGDKDILYSSIIKSFKPTLQKLSYGGLQELLHVISELDKEVLADNFPDVFDSVLYRISKSQGRYAGEFIQPVELTRFMCYLADLKEGAKVFNPFAGLASFGVYLSQGQDYFGQELNHKTWALGALRIMAFERPGGSRYVCDDSILHWPATGEKFDLIISNPPFGKLGNHNRDIEPNLRTIEQFLIEKGVQSLTQNGKLIALIPQGFLFRDKQEKRLRELLVEKDLIETIISLPGGLLLNTGIPLIILVLSRTKKLAGKVKFVDAKKFVISKGSREKVLNDYGLNSFIHSDKLDDNVIRIVHNRQIRDNDYNLSVSRYFQKQFDGVKLGDILELVQGHKGNLPYSGKVIRIRDLKDDKIDFALDLSSIEETQVVRSSNNLVSESCLLIAMRWRTLKPTLFEFNGEPIFRSPDIMSFKINEFLVDKAYLINELHAEYVQEQLESIRMGQAIPFIRIGDLLEVVVKLPSLQEQRAKFQGIYELSAKIKILQEERNALAHGVSSKLYESVSTIKHSLGKPLLNIGSSLRNIEKALSKFNVDWEHVKLNERYDLTIRDSFDSIFSNLDLIHSMLRNNEFVLDFSKYELTVIDLLAFIKGYVNRIKSAERSNVSTNLDIHPDIKIQLKNKVLILANVELLEIALNAVIENANMHAFTNDSKKYKLEFRISLYVAPGIKNQVDDTFGRFDTYIKVEVANNGKPFPKNYSLEKLIRKNSFAGVTGNTGQGGFDLNEIVKYHNNGMSTLELITDDLTTEFITTYSFLIPLNK